MLLQARVDLDPLLDERWLLLLPLLLDRPLGLEPFDDARDPTDPERLLVLLSLELARDPAFFL